MEKGGRRSGPRAKGQEEEWKRESDETRETEKRKRAESGQIANGAERKQQQHAKEEAVTKAEGGPSTT